MQSMEETARDSTFVDISSQVIFHHRRASRKMVSPPFSFATMLGYSRDNKGLLLEAFRCLHGTARHHGTSKNGEYVEDIVEGLNGLKK